MTYLLPADFRAGSLQDYTYGLDLTTLEAPDTQLTAAIASFSQRIDNMTNDHFESESRVFELNVTDASSRLYLPRRTRAISSVSTRDFTGAMTLESAASYRLFSSLDPTGSFRIENDGLDRLEIPSGQMVGLGYSRWPIGPQSVEVTGTFSWLVTPADIKWAVARLCYARFKESRAELDRADSLTNAGVTLRFLESDPEHPTGIREVDEIVTDYTRDSFIGVG